MMMMHIVSLHEMANPVFWENLLLSAELAQRVVKVKAYRLRLCDCEKTTFCLFVWSVTVVTDGETLVLYLSAGRKDFSVLVMLSGEFL